MRAQLNRLDEQIVFNSLDKDSILKIVDLRLTELRALLNHSAAAPDRRVDLVVESDVREWLARRGYEPRWGARALNRLISREIRKPLSEAILRGELANGDTAILKLRPDGEGIEVVPVKAAEDRGAGKSEDAEARAE